jgi:hypothetical protein
MNKKLILVRKKKPVKKQSPFKKKTGKQYA